jgi:hypothetical protein
LERSPPGALLVFATDYDYAAGWGCPLRRCSDLMQRREFITLLLRADEVIE